MRKYKIGVIGYGDFTKVILQWLEPYAEIAVSSRSRSEGDAGNGARFAPLEEVLSRPVIIPSFPSQYFEGFFKANKRLINPEALVIDVCSVKVKPLAVLEEYLPKTCAIIGTHPLFGPASVKRNGGIRGLRCVVSDVRSTKEQRTALMQFLQTKLGLVVLERTAEEHDKEMAYVMGLSHYIARVMDNMDIPKSELSTMAYDDLYDMKMVQAKDTWDLFESIMHENPFALEVNNKFKRAQKDLDAKISSELGTQAER